MREYKVGATYDQKETAVRCSAKAYDLFNMAFAMKSYGEWLGNDLIR